MATFTRRCIVDWGTTGVAASLYATVYNGSNTAVVARAVCGGEHPTGSGIYYKDVTWDNTWTSPKVIWDDGTNFAPEDMAVANVTQGNGSALIPEAGSGGDAVTLTFTNLGAPIADADVWITATTDPAAVVAGTRTTDSQGEVTFLLNAGTTYFAWLQKDGLEPIEAQEFVAVAD